MPSRAFGPRQETRCAIESLLDLGKLTREKYHEHDLVPRRTIRNDCDSRLRGGGRTEVLIPPTGRDLDFVEPTERVGFGRILLDLTARFAPLNRVIKHYQHVFGP